MPLLIIASGFHAGFHAISTLLEQAAAASGFIALADAPDTLSTLASIYAKVLERRGSRDEASELRELLKLLLGAPSLGRDMHAGGGFLTLAPYDGRDEQDADARAAALDNFARRCTVDEPLAMLCTEDEDVSFAPLRAIDLNVN